jgi:RNA polymerase sigma factor (sigma-70 family)
MWMREKAVGCRRDAACPFTHKIDLVRPHARADRWLTRRRLRCLCGAVEQRSNDDAQRTAEDGDFEAVYRAYRQALYRFFERRVATPAEAEDLVQDVYLRLVGRDRPEAMRNPEAFLFTIASNLLRDRARAARVRSSVLVDLGDAVANVAQATPGPDREAASRERLARAKAALLALPPDTRAIFVLHRFEGFSYRAIAEAKRITIAEVRKHLALAMNATIDALGEGEAGVRARTIPEASE